MMLAGRYFVVTILAQEQRAVEGNKRGVRLWQQVALILTGLRTLHTGFRRRLRRIQNAEMCFGVCVTVEHRRLLRIRGLSCTCHKGSGGIAPSILNLSTRWTRVVDFTPPPALSPEKKSVPSTLGIGDWWPFWRTDE